MSASQCGQKTRSHKAAAHSRSRQPRASTGSNRIICLHLEQHKVAKDHRLVHFRPQRDFLFLDASLWADEVVHIETKDIKDPRIVEWLGDRLNKTKNVTTEFSETGYQPERLSQDALRTIQNFYAEDFDLFDYDRLV